MDNERYSGGSGILAAFLWGDEHVQIYLTESTEWLEVHRFTQNTFKTKQTSFPTLN